MLKRGILLTVGVALLAMFSPVWPIDTYGADEVACDVDAKPADLDLTLETMQGGAVHLADYQGKVLLVDFWATWCGPCKIEIPGFVELYDTYRDQGFEVVGLLVEDQIEKAKPFAEKFEMNYPVLDASERDDVQEAFGPIWGLPTSFLISRDGKICRKHSGFAPKEQFEQEIKALL